MARRRSAAVRQQRNIDRAAYERQKHYIYTRCWLCGREFVVNNYGDLKPRVKRCKVGGKILCGRCRGDGNNWARRFMQMYLMLKRQHPPEDSQMGKLLKAIEDERPAPRLYRKRSVEPQEV